MKTPFCFLKIINDNIGIFEMIKVYLGIELITDEGNF
jgi:hypothetical protein